MRNMNQNVTQAGSGAGFNPLGMVLRGWQRKKEIDYRFGKEGELMLQQHELGKERDTHRAMTNVIADGSSKAISNYFDTTLENTKSGNKIKQTKESGRQERLTRTHGGNRDYKDSERLTRGLYENSLDPSKGVSPLTSKNLQKIGPLLGGNPLLGVSGGNAGTKTETPAADGGKKRGRKTKVAPIAPQVGTDATPDKGGWQQPELPFGDNPTGPSTGSPEVTAPKIKKARAPRVKKTGTDGGV